MTRNIRYNLKSKKKNISYNKKKSYKKINKKKKKSKLRYQISARNKNRKTKYKYLSGGRPPLMIESKNNFIDLSFFYKVYHDRFHKSINEFRNKINDDNVRLNIINSLNDNNYILNFKELLFYQVVNENIDIDKFNAIIHLSFNMIKKFIIKSNKTGGAKNPQQAMQNYIQQPIPELQYSERGWFDALRGWVGSKFAGVEGDVINHKLKADFLTEKFSEYVKDIRSLDEAARIFRENKNIRDQANLKDLNKKIGELKYKLKSLKVKDGKNKNLIEELRGKVELLENKDSENKKLLKNLQDEISKKLKENNNLESKVKKLQSEINEEKKLLDLKTKQLSDAEKDIRNKEKDIKTKENKIKSLEKNKSQQNNQLKKFRAELANKKNLIGSLRNKLNNANSEISKKNGAVKLLQQKLDENEKTQKNKLNQLNLLRSDLKEKDVKIKNLETNLSDLNNLHKKVINDNLLNVPDVKKLIDNYKQQKNLLESKTNIYSPEYEKDIVRDFNASQLVNKYPRIQGNPDKQVNLIGEYLADNQYNDENVKITSSPKVFQTAPSYPPDNISEGILNKPVTVLMILGIGAVIGMLGYKSIEKLSHKRMNFKEVNQAIKINEIKENVLENTNEQNKDEEIKRLKEENKALKEIQQKQVDFKNYMVEEKKEYDAKKSEVEQLRKERSIFISQMKRLTENMDEGEFFGERATDNLRQLKITLRKLGENSKGKEENLDDLDELDDEYIQKNRDIKELLTMLSSMDIKMNELDKLYNDYIKDVLSGYIPCVEELEKSKENSKNAHSLYNKALSDAQNLKENLNDKIRKFRNMATNHQKEIIKSKKEKRKYEKQIERILMNKDREYQELKKKMDTLQKKHIEFLKKLGKPTDDKRVLLIQVGVLKELLDNENVKPYIDEPLYKQFMIDLNDISKNFSSNDLSLTSIEIGIKLTSIIEQLSSELVAMSENHLIDLYDITKDFKETSDLSNVIQDINKLINENITPTTRRSRSNSRSNSGSNSGSNSRSNNRSNSGRNSRSNNIRNNRINNNSTIVSSPPLNSHNNLTNTNAESIGKNVMPLSSTKNKELKNLMNSLGATPLQNSIFVQARLATVAGRKFKLDNDKFAKDAEKATEMARERNMDPNPTPYNLYNQ